MHHDQQWTAPGPLWPQRPVKGVDCTRPVVLRLAGDDFMDRMLAALAQTDAQKTLAGWRIETAAPRLFQPVHGHFALVLAALACTLPGLPDHVVGPRDRVGFIVRRVLPDDREQAWVSDGAPDRGRWQSLPAAPPGNDQKLADEEVHPLFPVTWLDRGHPRRLWAGVIPLSARERYELAARQVAAVAGMDPWAATLTARFFDPLAKLLTELEPTVSPSDLVRASLLLLTLAELLQARCGDAWSDPRSDLGEALHGFKTRHSGQSKDLRTALDEAAAVFARLETTDPPDAQGFALLKDIGSNSEKLGLLRGVLSDVPGPAETPPEVGTEGILYRLRCVYERPVCGVRATVVLSPPSDPFRIAGFLDLDAPQRPVHIALPDLSLTGLARMAKSVAISMPNNIHAAAESACATTVEIEDDKLVIKPSKKPDDEPDDAGGRWRWVSIWSIPIITICATILLLIVATILDYFFKWLPYLRILFPVYEKK